MGWWPGPHILETHILVWEEGWLVQYVASGETGKAKQREMRDKHDLLQTVCQQMPDLVSFSPN